MLQDQLMVQEMQQKITERYQNYTFRSNRILREHSQR